MDNYSEQIVKKKIQPRKLMFIGFYFVFALVFIALTLYLSSYFGWLIPIALLVFGFGIYFAVYIVNRQKVEYEYICCGGEMTVDKIISKQKRKKMMKFDIKSIEELGKWSERPSDFNKKTYDPNIFHASINEKRDDTYYCVTHDMISKKHCLLYFTPDEKTLETMKPYLKRELRVKLFTNK